MARTYFVKPIQKIRKRTVAPEIKAIGQSRLAELYELLSTILLSRVSAIIARDKNLN